tara:strand:+ start:170 stop:487 length:318 start_codon:yes stop_codon:yes gene_type:complete
MLKYIFIILFLFVTACGGTWDNVKRGLGGSKKNSTDEFLVKKKDPLVLPPKFNELPEPGQSLTIEEEEFTDIEAIIKSGKNQESSVSITESGSLEESVLKKIRQK